MGGTVEGGRMAASKNKQRLDSTYLDKYCMTFYQYIGSKGGKRGHTGGFAAMPKWKVSAAGRKGGEISKRTKKKV